MTVINATDADYETTLAAAKAAGKTTLVDFWAPWCGPCRQVSPIVEQIATEHPEYVIVKVDIDQATNTAQGFGVMSVPTIAIISASGDVAQVLAGPKPKRVLLDALASA